MEDLAKNCKADIRLIMKEGEKQKKEDEEASQERCARMKQDIQRLGTQFNALVLEHRASELVLRKVKGRRALGQEVKAFFQSCQLWLLPAARSSLVPACSWQDAHGVCQSTPALSSCSADSSGKQPCSDSRDRAVTGPAPAGCLGSGNTFPLSCDTRQGSGQPGWSRTRVG